MLPSLPIRIKIGLIILIVLSLYSLAFNSPDQVKAVTLKCIYSTPANACKIQFDLSCPPGTHQDRQCPLDESCGLNGFDIQCISNSIPTPAPTPVPTDCTSAGGMCQPHDPSLCLGAFVSSPQCSPQMDSTGSSFQCCLPANPPIPTPTPSPAPPPDISGLSSIKGEAFPKNAPIPCDKERDTEFSSDRPYQASPCGDPQPTFFCGNTIIIDLGGVSTPYCDPINGVKTSCSVDVERDQNIIVDLTNVQLPILGNTQLTINSKNSNDQIDDGTKVNNFVAWYLNGTNDKAEYPAVDITTPEGLRQVVDTSGPIKKLLPSAILDAQRYDTINTAIRNEPPFIDAPQELPDETDPLNHNQIVVCTTANTLDINLLGLNISIPWFGALKPAPCYTESDDKLRLKDWGEGSLSFFTTFFNFLGAEKWNNKFPPLPWNFTSNLYYQKAYNEWRGATCIIIPIFNTLSCTDIPLLSPNRTWSDLYPYVPLASTVDKRGVQAVSPDSVNVLAPKTNIELTKPTEVQKSPNLYLAHSLENYSLTNILKTTYVPTATDAGKTKGYPGATIPNDVEDNSSMCSIVESRINPGDDATFSKPKSYVSVSVHYKITQVECSKPEYTCLLGFCSWKATCRSGVMAEIKSLSKTPYADEIWQNSVAGSDSIYRRIYPKNGPDAPVTCIADVPAVSPATYTLDRGASTAGISLEKIIEPDGTTSFTGDGTKIAAQLYYPHYGGVLDYFLKGIQTALRPQGFGPPTPLSGQYCTDIACGELPVMPKAAGSCSLGGISSRVGNIPQSLKDIVEAAAQTYNTPPNLILAEMYGEGLFNEGRFDWTDQNVKNWATCIPIPGCSTSGADNFMGFYSANWPTIAAAITPAISALDPTREAPSQCNLLDSIYAAAWNLHDAADGGGGLPPTCYGITLKSTIPTTCSWNPEQYESAIKVVGSGYTSSCLTLPGSCAGGGGLAAACPNGDNCETIRTTGNTSHNACVWEVAHGE